MPHYRATIRFTEAGQKYEVIDLTANSVREALRLVADQFPDAALASADLVEIRLQADQDERESDPE